MSPLEQLAHDVICIIKYGSPGGSTNSAEVKRVAEYLDRMCPLPEQPKTLPKIATPKVAGLPVVVMHNPVTAPKLSVEAVCLQFKVTLPGIST